ncbi:MAG: B12-binding domain-containing radical SAM protein [Vallitaleaceae bacterium]|nr:B12-binding domain-containing radical SAM protein [Vallitaleaceae bacterium]
MKHLLIGINAKFIHSNLAIRYIQAYGEKKGLTIEYCEYTINQSLDYILDEIIKQEPNVVGFSCYLWNIEIIVKLFQMIRQIRPKMLIVLGGPEVSYNPVMWMTTYPEIDYVISGEGEISTVDLFTCLEKGHDDALEQVGSLSYRDEDRIKQNHQVPPMSMAEVPFAYKKDLLGLEHRIIYYETSRGCPFNCEYCLSSIEKGVRFRPLNRVFEELQFFLDQGVLQVKFVDRTFNAKKSHSMAIWSYLKDHDNGKTNFHFEITADLLDEAEILFLKTVRTGLFQFEIGVQSTNYETIVDINRQTDFEMLKKRVLSLKANGNIHLHLDLIAGLPKETYLAFGKSFNDVMAIRPEQLQLGFLKVLKGSEIDKKQETYGIVSRKHPPYEVLKTREMSYEDLRRLKDIEVLLEYYYNSGQFSNSIAYLMDLYDHPFAFFEDLRAYWEAGGLHHIKHHKIKFYDLLYEFGQQASKVDEDHLSQWLIHDLCLQEKPKKWPDFAHVKDGLLSEVKNFYQIEDYSDSLFKAYEGYNTKQIMRMTHVERYDFNPLEGPKDNVVSYIFYNYKMRDKMTGQAIATRIRL